MGYEINLGNGEWATGQGGMAMTVTDTDTGVKEAILMGCGRNANKTARNKDGLLYDVLPYEPSVSYIDGVGVLNNERQRGNKLPFSYDFTNAAWIKNKIDTPIPTNDSPHISLPAYVIKSNDSLASIQDTIQGIQGNNYASSIWVKKKKRYREIRMNGIENTQQVIEVTTEWKRFTIPNTASSTTLRLGLVISDAGDEIIVFNGQIEDGLIATSDIFTNGTTYTRLADTGFQTPDISKWINSESFSFEITCSLLVEGTTQRVSLFNKSNGANNRIEFIFSSATDTIKGYAIGNGSVYLNNVNITTSLDRTLENKYRVDLISGVLYFYINDVLEYTSSGGVVFDNLGILALEKYNSTTSLYAHVKKIKIES